VDSISGGRAELRGDDARHLARVLRVEAGQQYEISDNQSAWLARILESRGDRVVFEMVEPLPPAPVPVQITLCPALIKFDHFEWMIEKATELGVARILPVETARTEKGLYEASRKRSERWTKIAREGSQQSRRDRMPEILPAVRFHRALAREAASRIFLDENGGPALWRTLPETLSPSEEILLLIGPEGGWTDHEREAAAGWQRASLAPNILRTETAAIAALAVVVHLWGGLY
jgi:16S rRNA (uracil1498-N3)-methyltransferase